MSIYPAFGKHNITEFTPGMVVFLKAIGTHDKQGRLVKVIECKKHNLKDPIGSRACVQYSTGNIRHNCSAFFLEPIADAVAARLTGNIS